MFSYSFVKCVTECGIELIVNWYYASRKAESFIHWLVWIILNLAVRFKDKKNPLMATTTETATL
jgi:hypothetical protein